MNKLSTESYKGVRDFYPADMAIQNYIFDTWKTVLHHHGYQEYDASILEPAELYEAKTGDEIVNEQTYTFTDRGNRRVTLRPEMTPTVARMVAARRKELAFPLRWFSIPNLFRYERPQRGRLREHWQLNVDLFGVEGLQAEAEVIQVSYDLLTAFGLTSDQFEIKVNDRKLMDEFFESLNLDTEQRHKLAKLIDKKAKIDNFDEQAQEIVGGNFSFDLEANETLTQLIETLEKRGITNVTFDPTLMRGFDYYNGVVFEVFDKHPDNNRSLFGGGRYDKLLDIFGAQPVPTVGFGYGDVTMKDVLKTYDLLPNLSQNTDIYLCVIGDYINEASLIASQLRKRGEAVIIDYSNKKVGDQINRAEKAGAQHVAVLGEDELKDITVENLNDSFELIIKDLETKKEFRKTLGDFSE